MYTFSFRLIKFGWPMLSAQHLWNGHVVCALDCKEKMKRETNVSTTKALVSRIFTIIYDRSKLNTQKECTQNSICNGWFHFQYWQDSSMETSDSIAWNAIGLKSEQKITTKKWNETKRNKIKNIYIIKRTPIEWIWFSEWFLLNWIIVGTSTSTAFISKVHYK